MAQEIYIRFRGDASHLNRTVSQVDAALNNLQRSARGASNGLDRMERSGRGLGISLNLVSSALAAIGGAAVIKGIVGSYLEFERYQTVLTTFLGSASAANKELDRLQKLANELPQDLSDVTQAFTIFTRMGLDTSSESLTAFSNIATANAKSLTQFAEAVADAMTGEFERLKEFGIRVSKENDQFVARIGSQQVALASSTEDLVKQLRALGEEGGRFGSAAENNAKTLAQAFSNLQGAVFTASVAIGQTLAPTLIAASNALTAVLSNTELVIGVFGRIASYAAVAAVGIVGIRVAMVAAAAATALLTGGLVALRVALARTGIGLIVIAAGELVYRFMELTRKAGSFNAALVVMKSYATETIDKISAGFSILPAAMGVATQYMAAEFYYALHDMLAAFASFYRNVAEGINSIGGSLDTEPFTEGLTALNRAGNDAMGAMQGYAAQIDAAWNRMTAPYETTKALDEAQRMLRRSTQQTAQATQDQAAAAEVAAGALGKMNKEMVELLANFRAAPDALEVARGGISAFERLNPLEGARNVYVTELAGLEVLRNRDLINEEEFLRTKAQLHQEYATKVADINKNLLEENLRSAGITNQAILDAYTGFDQTYQAMAAGTITGYQAVSDVVGNVLNDLGKTNKRAFEAAKAYNIAVAIMNTITGITKALSAYPPPFNFLAAAAVGAAGYAQVAAIRNQQYSGRALGGPVMGNQSYMVGENGPEMFTPATSGRVTRNDQLDSSKVEVNFTINAIDSRGIDELLINRRGTIQQIISDAMIERGQRRAF